VKDLFTSEIGRLYIEYDNKIKLIHIQLKDISKGINVSGLRMKGSVRENL
jgi:hypothetical protein